jgi:hypothetical protein
LFLNHLHGSPFSLTCDEKRICKMKDVLLFGWI